MWKSVAIREASEPIKATVFVGAIGWGLNFLGHHDTESGHIPLLAALGLGLAIAMGSRWRSRRRPGRAQVKMIRPAWFWAAALTAAWIIPTAALMAGVLALNHPEERILV